MQRSERTSLTGALSGLGWPLILGLAACSIFYFLIFEGPLDTTSMHRYFATHPVSVCASGMFFVGLAALILKLIDNVRQLVALPRIELGLPSGELTRVDECPHLLDRLDELPRSNRASYLGQRLRDALEFIERQRSARGLGDELKYLADVDAGRQQESFALVRIIIWATPMLGFLGTVVGITQALGDLGTQSELLATDPKTAMQGLLAGLYVAFDTTALALSLSIVLMFIQFLVDRIETYLLAQVDQRTTDELAGCFLEEPGVADPQLAAVERMAEAVLRTTEQLVGRQTAHWEATIDNVGDKWDQMFASSADHIRSALSESLDRSLDHLADRLGKLEDEADQQMRARWEQWQTALSDNARALHSQQQEMVRQGEIMSKVLHATADVMKLEQALNENLRTLAGSQNFEETVMSLAAAIHLLNARLGQQANVASPVALESDKQGRAA